MDYRLRCSRCASYSRDNTRFRCRSCGSVLEVEYNYRSLALPGNFRSMRISNGKYVPFFPVESLRAGLGEGGTQLLQRHMRITKGIKLYLKMETKNPTRSFKDRGSSVEITKALDFGFDRVVCASTGNMGMSIAHYAKAMGIGATIFISANANKAKVAKIRKYGARVVRVDKDFNEALRKAEAFALSESAFVCGDYHFRKEGQKTVIYEILEQMRYDVPDFIFVPVGNATLLSAIHKGLMEFRMLGWIDRLPRIIAVQSEGCDPLVRAYGRKSRISYMVPNTVADAIAVGYPTFGTQGLMALRDTRGDAIRVPDHKITEAVRLLGKEGIFAETGGAAGFAGLLEMRGWKGRLLEGKKVVVVVTGNNEPRGRIWS